MTISDALTNQTAKTQIPQKQRVSGVMLIDKPKGLTSQQVVSKVKYLFKSAVHDSKKAGHTGTLDPMATGLLPICLGESTKFSHYQLDANKTYLATIKLGAKTDTGDAEGQIIENRAVPAIIEDDCQKIVQQFLGEGEQIPPMYSALKKDGKKLYEYARAGIEVERAPRPIIIYDMTLKPDTTASETLILKVTCSKGTYVRVLGEDIAQALGTVGHLTSLRRLKVGDFDISDALTLAELEKMSLDERFEQLLAVDACIAHLPILKLTDTQWQRVQVGQRLNVSEQITPALHNYLATPEQRNASDIRLISETGVFIGLASLESNGRLQPKKIMPVV